MCECSFGHPIIISFPWVLPTKQPLLHYENWFFEHQKNLKPRIYFLKLTHLKAAASCVPVIKISFSLISPINSLLSYIQLGSTRRHLDSVTGSYIPFGSFSKFENLDGCLWWFRCDEDVSSIIWTQYSNCNWDHGKVL